MCDSMATRRKQAVTRKAKVPRYGLVETDLDTLVVALYVIVDDLLGRPTHRRPGHRPELSDSEVACLAVAQVLLRCPSERLWLRGARHRLGHLFPYLPQQAGYNKRLRACAPLLIRAMGQLALVTPSWCDSLRLFDATPVPCAASRETVKRSALRSRRDAHRLVPGQPQAG
jgi:hypothetical protein